jgi:hypothetical protein
MKACVNYFANSGHDMVVGGAYAKWTSSAAAAFDFGAAVLRACPVILWEFNRFRRLSRAQHECLHSVRALLTTR